MTPFELIATLVGSILGSSALGVGISGWFNRKKMNADASTSLVEATLKWASSMAERIKVLEERLIEREKVIDDLQTRISDLEEQVATLLRGNHVS